MQKPDRSASREVLQLTGITVELIDVAIRAVVILILINAVKSDSIAANPCGNGLRDRIDPQPRFGAS